MNVTDTALSLLYQFYGLSFFILGLSAYIIPGRNLNFSIFRHARWLSAFGILHGFVGFLAGEANRNPGILLPWFIIFFVGISFMCMLEFSRRIWNDCSFGKYLPIHPIIIVLLLLPQIYIFFAVENVTGGLDIGFRLLFGTPAMIIAGSAIFFRQLGGVTRTPTGALDAPAKSDGNRLHPVRAAYPVFTDLRHRV